MAYDYSHNYHASSVLKPRDFIGGTDSYGGYKREYGSSIQKRTGLLALDSNYRNFNNDNLTKPNNNLMHLNKVADSSSIRQYKRNDFDGYPSTTSTTKNINFDGLGRRRTNMVQAGNNILGGTASRGHDEYGADKKNEYDPKMQFYKIK